MGLAILKQKIIEILIEVTGLAENELNKCLKLQTQDLSKPVFFIYLNFLNSLLKEREFNEEELKAKVRDINNL
jgi:hypothetical protein